MFLAGQATQAAFILFCLTALITLIAVVLFNCVPAWACLNEGATPVFMQRVTQQPISVKSGGIYEF